MGSNKTTINKKSLLILLVVLVIGIGIGAIIGDIPFITFKHEVDLGSLIAIVGIIATVFYLPNVVERKFKKVDNINEVIRADIEAIIDDVERLKTIYVGIKPSVKVKLTTYIEILAIFKSISAAILALNEQLVSRNRLSGFKNDVYTENYVPAKVACTDDLLTNKVLDTNVTLNAVSQLDKLCSQLRKYRYETFAES